MKMPVRAVSSLILILCLALVSACGAAGPQVELAGQTFEVEIADEPREQALGLMFREQMPADAGMLFIFPEENPRSFWMKNCRIPLDILFFDRDMKLINVHHSVPPCRTSQCPSYPSKAPAQYVLELNGGTIRSMNVEPGAEMVFRP